MTWFLEQSTLNPNLPYKRCIYGVSTPTNLVNLLRQLVEVGGRGPVPGHVVVLPEDVPPGGVQAERAQDQHEVSPLETLVVARYV